MPEMMKAIRKLKPAKGLDVVEVPVPELSPNEVLVHVEAASICGTDIHIWQWDQWSQRRIKPPVTVGHELAGTVVKVGSAVRVVSVGDYVSAESHVTCGMCFQCRTGMAHMCPKTSILGVDRNGVFAQYVAIPETIVWQNDRSKLSPEIASLQEPFGNAVFATLSGDISGHSVAIFGCGPIGLFSVGIAKASGASLVLATDVNDYRLQLARRMGAGHAFDVSQYKDPESLIQTLVEANEGSGIDVVMEMSGAPSAITTAFRAVRNGGRVVLFGIPARPVEIDVAENMIFKNLQVLAINGRRIWDTWYRTRWLLEHGVVDLKPLVTKEIDFDEFNDACEMLADGKACKIILRPNGREIPAAARYQARPNEREIRGSVGLP